jgi:hypothetical protein
MTEGPGMQQWNEGSRCKMVAVSEEGEDIWQDLQEDHRVGGLEASSWDFHWVVESE